VVLKGSRESIIIMGADGYEGAVAAEVAVELVLEVDERLVALLVEGNVAEDGADDKGADR
jgi:hypothetical protein